MTTLIEVSGLRKQYRSSFGKAKITALDGIDFSVAEGEMFGLLGPNGAGKTTTVKILLGLTHATSGDAKVCGLPVRDPESRRHVGYLPEGHKIPELPDRAAGAVDLRPHVGNGAARASKSASRSCSNRCAWRSGSTCASRSIRKA